MNSGGRGSSLDCSEVRHLLRFLFVLVKRDGIDHAAVSIFAAGMTASFGMCAGFMERR